MPSSNLQGTITPIKFSYFLLLLIFIGILSPNASFALTPAEIEAAQQQAEAIQRLEQERLFKEQEEARLRSNRPGGLDTSKLTPQIKVPEIGASCRDIKNIIIKGAPSLPHEVKKEINNEFSNRCLNVGDIEKILSWITKNYIDRGYVTTRAYLAPQDLSKGLLEVLVIEGVIEKIIINDGKKESISMGNAFPGLNGRPLNLRDLEQGLDQINRLFSNNATLNIEPGNKVGASRVIVSNRPSSLYHFNASLDNQGSKSTGKHQLGVTASVDNLMGFNDFFSVTHRESVPNDHKKKYSSSDNLSFNIPFGYNTISVGLSKSKYVSSLIVPSGTRLISSGSNKSENIRFDRLIYRDQSTRAKISATVTTKESRNFLDNAFLGVSSRKLTILDLAANINTPLAGGVISFDLGLAQGLDLMGALSDPKNLPDSAPRAQFTKFKVGFDYTKPISLFNKNLSIKSQLTAQKAFDSLYGSEQISIGGLYSVRGFVNNTIAGDDGFYLRNELSMRQPITIGNQTFSTRIYAAYDIGTVRSRAVDVPEGTLSGMAIGISGNWHGVSWDLSNSMPLSMPSNMTKESAQTWFRLAYSF